MSEGLLPSNSAQIVGYREQSYDIDKAIIDYIKDKNNILMINNYIDSPMICYKKILIYGSSWFPYLVIRKTDLKYYPSFITRIKISFIIRRLINYKIKLNRIEEKKRLNSLKEDLFKELK